MKILISIGTLGLGGAEKQAVWLANQLSEFHEVTLLTYHGGARETDLNPKVTWKTIFELQEKNEENEIISANVVHEELSAALEGFTGDELLSQYVASSKIDSIPSGLMINRMKELLKNFPFLRKILISTYSKTQLILRFFRSTKTNVFKVAKKPKYLWLISLRLLNYFLNSMKSKALRILAKDPLLKMFQRLLVNFNNQTFVFKRARKVIKSMRPDLVITFLFHDTLNVGLAGLAQIKRPKLIVGRRSPIGYGDGSRNRFHKFILRVIYKFSSLAISNSAGNVESALRDGISKRKIKIIGNFVTKGQLSNVPLTSGVPLEILCIANFHWYKNHEGLLRAITLIPNHENYFHITFVGDGPLFEEIKQLAFELKVSACFRGFVENPSSQIQFFQALILVSHIEGSSNALLEGLVSGVPALVSKAGAAEELFSQGAPIVLCESNDVQSIADGLIELRDNYSILQSQARNFAEVIGATLSEETVLSQWQQAIHDVTSS
jgi:glycosyltransferase involved in cell wall biosynthesis